MAVTSRYVKSKQHQVNNHYFRTMTKEESKQMRIVMVAYRTFNHPLRQDILNVIRNHKDEDMPVNTIYRELRIEQSICSGHLRLLEKNKFIYSRREGKFVYYKRNEKLIDQIRNQSKHTFNLINNQE